MIRHSMEDAVRQREDFDRLKAELARWTYKPGWTFELALEPNIWALAMLTIRYEAIDSRDPTRTIPIMSRVSVDDYMAQDSDQFARWLQHQVLSCERHESREWLRRDGDLYDDPHAEGAGR